MTTFEKYWWVFEHPKLNVCPWSQPTIELTPHMVEPLSSVIQEDHSLNTKMEWWIEVMTHTYNEDEKDYVSTHLWKFDCGGETIDEAIDNLYNLVLKEYGTYEEE